MEKSDSTEVKNSVDIGLSEFIKISKWIISFIFSIEPKYSSFFLASSLLRALKETGDIYIFSRILDALIKGVTQKSFTIEELYPYLAVMFAYQMLGLLVYFTRSLARAGLNYNLRYKISTEHYKKLYELGIQTLENPEINNKIHRSSEGINNITPFFFNCIDLISNGTRILASLIILLNLSPLLILAIFLFKIPYYLHDRKYRGMMYILSKENTDGMRKASTNSGDLSSSKQLHEIFVNRAFNFLHNKNIQFWKWYTKIRTNTHTKWMVGLFSLSVPGDFIVLYGYVVIFNKFITKLISVGTVSFYISNLKQLDNYMEGFLEIFNEMTGEIYLVKDTYYIFNTYPSFQDGVVEIENFQRGPEIEFKNVSFKYPGSEKFIYENLNLKINSGEKVAIVGHNGAGKTTLVKLISRFYQVNEGEILVNGINVNDIKIDSLYKNLGVMFQDFNTYSQLTAKENIIMGNPSVEIDEEKIIDSAKNADALSMIEDLPNKFETVLSEKFKGGVRLSTGQWQKLAIARFFYKNAPLAIFDEPTAAIDAVSEYNIFNKIYEFFTGKTVIIISHRFSTVRNADRIIVVENGKIIEEGSHRKLMEKAGSYAYAFKLQAEGYQN